MSSEQGLNELVDGFIGKLRTDGKGPNTLKNYQTDLNCFKDFLIQEQKSLQLNDFNLIKTKHYGSYLDNRYPSANSKRRRVQTLRLFFDYLVSRGIYKENPVRKILASPKFLDIPRPASYKDMMLLWRLLQVSKEDSELEALIKRRNQVVFLLIYCGCLKVSDIEQIKKDHLNLEKDLRVLVIPPKRDPYTVPLPEAVKQPIMAYLLQLRRYQANNNMDFDQLLFNANHYRILQGGLSARGIEIIFKDFCRRYSINLTAKSIRQAGIYRLLLEGHKDGLIKEWLGVSPSYSLSPYKKTQDEFAYNTQFIGEVPE